MQVNRLAMMVSWTAYPTVALLLDFSIIPLKTAEACYSLIALTYKCLFPAMITSWQRNLYNARTIAQAEREKLFFMCVANELRNPLHAAVGFTELMQHEADSLPKSHSTMLLQVDSSLRHMNRLVNDLLDLGAVDHGKVFILRDQRFTLRHLMHTLGVLTKHRQDSCKVDLVVRFSDESLADRQFVADSQRVLQIAINLTDNAIKFSENLQPVIITCSEVTASRLRIRFQNFGKGISPEEQTMLFKPFSQLSKAVPGGSGCVCDWSCG
jgi:hypothetical protein